MTRQGSIILGDIGGTNIRLALGTQQGISEIKIFPTSSHTCLSDALNEYTNTLPVRPSSAFLGVAGPVPQENFLWPNGWKSFLISDEEHLANLRLELINDFEAAALGVMALQPGALTEICSGIPVDRATKIIIGPGTGLGAASLLWNELGYAPVGRGGTHPDMPLNTSRDKNIHHVLQEKLGHVTVESVCCGQGLVNIHDALCVLDSRQDLIGRSPEDISVLALRKSCPVAREALDKMMEYLGWAAAHYSMKQNGSGGVYIAGGVITKLGDYFLQSPFKDAFKNALGGRMPIPPVYVVKNPDQLAFTGLHTTLLKRHAFGPAV